MRHYMQTVLLHLLLQKGSQNLCYLCSLFLWKLCVEVE